MLQLVPVTRIEKKKCWNGQGFGLNRTAGYGGCIGWTRSPCQGPEVGGRPGGGQGWEAGLLGFFG